MPVPGFTAELAISRPGARGRVALASASGGASGADIIPAVHCHLETHTPDEHTYLGCPAHTWLGWDCVYVYCD